MGRVSTRLPTPPTPPGRTAPGAAPGQVAHAAAWALAAVVAGYAAMCLTAGLGLWAAGAADLPGGSGAFVAVLAAVVVMATGGEVSLSGEAGSLAGTQAELTAMPLTVTLVGALVTGGVFLRPLRHHAVAPARALLALAVPTVVFWLAGLGGLTALARHDFPISLGGTSEDTGDLGDLFKDLLDATDPKVGFTTDVGPTLFYGLLWILGVLVVALLVSRRTPLPPRLVRHHQAVRPAASAMLLLVLAYVAVALVIGVVVAATRGHAAETLAVLLLGLPNVAWVALGVGIGGSWEGRVEGPFGLPMPQLLDSVLRGGDGGKDLSTVDLSGLAAYDGRAWWLLPIAAVLVLAAAFLAAVRSPAGVPLWRHAVHVGVAFAVTMLVVAPLTNVEASFGLSILGIGDLGALGADVVLRPHVWKTVGLALLWGLVTGFLGALLATRVRRRGEVPADKP
ncbi:streptophobe family protein [Streptomyces roseicoloratus]|uniref:Streptophobe family protein n=1 Tax=Streptomyces roseicoloratus TaxID=2508722 RepID=A0ABY9S4S4_9ACTN|nr:streptophobe family protein [Streptomyces roseicoloratus]WMX48404.1 streptophobe family protein [Streptomyces roseicoloratus]